MGPDWGVNMELVDMISSTFVVIFLHCPLTRSSLPNRNGPDAARALRKRLTSSDSRVLILALTVRGWWLGGGRGAASLVVFSCRCG